MSSLSTYIASYNKLDSVKIGEAFRQNAIDYEAYNFGAIYFTFFYCFTYSTRCPNRQKFVNVENLSFGVKLFLDNL